MGQLTDKLRSMLRDNDDPQLWTNEELNEYLQMTADAFAVVMETPGATASDLIARHPTIRTALIVGGVSFATRALSLNAVRSDDGSWRVGGIEIPKKKAEKYDSLAQTTPQDFDRLLNSFTETVKVIKGLRKV